jgi:DNA primase
LPGNLVKTEKGYHRIEDIKVGDSVLTHRGRYMPVTRLLWRPYEGEIISIRLRKSSELTVLTADHEVFAIKTKMCPHKSRQTRICQWNCKKEYCPRFHLNYKIEKIPARNLARNDFLLFPVNRQIRDIETIDLDKYYNRKISNFGPKIHSIPAQIRVDEKFLKLLGYYIAEGSNHRAYVRFSLGNHEKKFAVEIRNLIKEIFGIKTGIYSRRRGNRTGLEISACNSKLANIFENLCGLHAENKHIPFELQYLSPEKQKIILEAIYKGDGFREKVNRCKNSRYSKAITVISLTLAEQLRDILLRLGVAPTFRIQKEKTDKKKVHHKKSFTVKWQENYILNFSNFLENKGILYWLLPIKDIEIKKYKGDVYNLTVDKDHSYIAQNFAVGNCGSGGDIFKFVMQIEGVEFGDALRILAQRAGVELRRQTPEYTQWKTERQELHDVCELATKFFEKQLQESKWGKEAKDYLLSRKITEESIKKWRIGYAPDVWQGLADFLNSRGYQQGKIKEAGLGLSSEKGSFYDRFRGRIIFPIFDLNSQIVGFGGRVFKDKDNKEIAKYVNTPQTVLYDKSRILYGLDKAKVEIRKKNACILVEGYTDVIMAHQAGTQNVVATSGTALTPFQLRILKRYTENLILGFDMDVAGDTATKRGIDLAQSVGFNIKVLRLPEGKDAAEIISKNEKEWQESLLQPKSIMDFYFESAFSGRDKRSAEDKKEISKILLPIIKRIPNSIVQAHWVNELAKKLAVKEEVIEQELKKVKLEEYPEVLGVEEEEIKSLPVKSRRELLEERLVILILKSPQSIDLVKGWPDKFSEPIREVLMKLKSKSKIDSDFYNYLALRADVEEIEEEEIASEIQCCLKEIAAMEIKNKLDGISQEIITAEEEKDWKKVERLTKEFNQLIKDKR